jgi:hypothetical protein
MFVTSAVAAQNLGVGLRQPCRGKAFGDMHKAMARIAPSQPNEAMAHITPRSPMVPTKFLSTQVRFFKVQIDSKRWEKKLGARHHQQVTTTIESHSFAFSLAAKSAESPIMWRLF